MSIPQTSSTCCMTFQDLNWIMLVPCSCRVHDTNSLAVDKKYYRLYRTSRRRYLCPSNVPPFGWWSVEAGFTKILIICSFRSGLALPRQFASVLSSPLYRITCATQVILVLVPKQPQTLFQQCTHKWWKCLQELWHESKHLMHSIWSSTNFIKPWLQNRKETSASRCECEFRV